MKEEDSSRSHFGSLAPLESHGGVERTFGLFARDVSEHRAYGYEHGDEDYRFDYLKGCFSCWLGARAA